MPSTDPSDIRILVIDKTAVLPHVRDRWRRVAEQGRFVVTLLAPREWIENGVRYRLDESRTDRLIPIAGRTLFTGAELRGVYLSGAVKAFRSSRPDVVVMMEESFAMFGLQAALLRRLFAPRAPLIFYCNLITSYSLPGYRLAPLYRWIARRVTPRAARALCVNERALAVLDASGFDVPARILFYGIDESRFVESDQQPARDAIGIEREGTTILYLGRLLELKGIDDLIDAVARRRSLRPDERLRLMIVGSGPYREQLLRRINEAGLDNVAIVREAVPIDRVPAYIAAADILVLPSRAAINEQLGRVLVEAMFMGRLVIGSTSGGIPEVIEEGGYIFRADDPDDLHDAIARAIDDPAESERRRRLGQARALQRYSTGGFVEGFVGLIGEMIGELTGRTPKSERVGKGS